MKAYKATREGETEAWVIIDGIPGPGTHQIVLRESEARDVADKLTDLLEPEATRPATTRP